MYIMYKGNFCLNLISPLLSRSASSQTARLFEIKKITDKLVRT